MHRSVFKIVERGKHDREQRQQALIEAATAVFAERGYDGATTREIAARSGCAEGLIHRYFQGKRGLLLAIMHHKVGEVVEDFKSGLPPRETVEEEIDQLLCWHLTVMWERRDFMRVCVSEAAIDSELGRSIGDGLNRSRVEQIVERLRGHREAGRIRDDIDLEAVALSIADLGFTLGFFAQVVFEMDREDVHGAARSIARVLSRGIVAREPVSPRQRRNP